MSLISEPKPKYTEISGKSNLKSSK